MNLRFKWVGRWSSTERKLRLFRVMWESGTPMMSHKVSVSITRLLPRITLRKSGGLFV